MLSGFISITLSFLSFTISNTALIKSNLTGYDYRLFQNTPAWTIAKAVKQQDTIKIIDCISKNKALIAYKEPKFGETLLQIAVMTLKYNSVKTLLKLGADPNSQDIYAGSSPFMDAAEILLTDDGNYGSNPKYLELLLQYGGDPNAEQRGPRPEGYNVRLTPLLNACLTGYLDYVKILVNAGANLKYDNRKYTPFFAAVTKGKPEVVMYLIEKGADYKKPLMKNIEGKELYLTDFMKNWNLNPNEIEKKNELIAFLKNNGMNY